MNKYEKVIKGLECCAISHYEYRYCDACPYSRDHGMCVDRNVLYTDALALLKAQEPATIEPKRIELADETKAWLDQMDAVDALGNIADICIDWDGYRTANGLGGLVNEIWAYARYCANRLAKVQEPVKPVPDTSYGARPWWFVCGNCKLSVNEDQKYCPNCGRAVKWE